MKKQIFILMFGIIFLSADHVVAMDEIKLSNTFTVGTPVQMLEAPPKWFRAVTKNFSLKKGQTLSFIHELDVKEGSVYWGLSQNNGKFTSITEAYGSFQYTARRMADQYLVDYVVKEDMNDVRLGLHSGTMNSPKFTVKRFQAKIKNSKDEFKKK